jgi:tRNA (guanine-N7-)-methyltransferase
MAQKKLFRFSEIKKFPNVYEYPLDMKGKWRQHFKNNHPIILELACGRGEYTVGLANLYPDSNFIGIDIKGNRMYIGAKNALENQLHNAAFLRTQIEMCGNYFAPGEVDEIWITFPDPQLRLSKAKKRLTHPRFLKIYQMFLKPNGVIHLKTDSPQLFQFTRTVANLFNLRLHKVCDDVYSQETVPPELSIKTHYEMLDIAQSKKVHYIAFSLPDVIPDKDEELKALLIQTADEQQS